MCDMLFDVRIQRVKSGLTEDLEAVGFILADRREQNSPETQTNMTFTAVFSSLYKSPPRVSCSPSGSLRRSRCLLWDKSHKHPTSGLLEPSAENNNKPFDQPQLTEQQSCRIICFIAFSVDCWWLNPWSLTLTPTLYTTPLPSNGLWSCQGCS